MCSKILVVDDDIDIRRLLSGLLEYEGYYVELVKSGEEALENIKKAVFDLIIIDIKLPGMDGFELLEKIRAMKVDSAVIFITGYGSIDSAIKALKLGASDYLEKPFDLVQFKSLVSKLLAVY